jgi:hypothetical protein
MLDPRIPLLAHVTIALAIKLSQVPDPTLTLTEVKCIATCSLYAGTTPEGLADLKDLMMDSAHACVAELQTSGLSRRDIARSLVAYLATPEGMLPLN